MGLLILKYAAWALTNGLAILGAWFVNFTQEGTGDRKTLTRWGKIALPCAVISLVLALTLTIKDDVEEAEKSTKRDTSEAQRDQKLTEILDVVGKKQEATFKTTSENLNAMTLPPQVNKEINDLYDRRKKLKEEWERLYHQYAELNREANRNQHAFERQQLSIKMSEIAQEIESILDRLAAFEKKTRDQYIDRRPPLPPGGLRIVPPGATPTPQL